MLEVSGKEFYDPERQRWARAAPRQGQHRLERSQGIARAQFRPIFRVGDEQGRGRVRVMEVPGQDQEAQGQAEPGQLCTALEINDQSRPEE